MTNQTWVLAQWTYEDWERGPDYPMSSKHVCMHAAEFLETFTDLIIFWSCVSYV